MYRVERWNFTLFAVVLSITQQHFYRPRIRSKKEGNVFSRVDLSVHRRPYPMMYQD